MIAVVYFFCRLCYQRFVVISVVSEAAHNRANSASRSLTADVRSSSLSNPAAASVHLPTVDIPHVTCSDVVTSVGRLSTLPPPTPQRAAVAQSAVTRSHSLRAADRRCGASNVAKRHSTSSVTTSPSASYDGSRPHLRRSALLAPPTCNVVGADAHR